MGARGYPLLLAAGETADGATPLVDRQHPHDLFMELSASYSLPLGGPQQPPSSTPACRASRPSGRPPSCTAPSIMDSPEAPISHHWLDSTHISFGVVTAGLVLGDFKLEGSRFNGREPDRASLEHRDRAAGFDRLAPVLEPGPQPVAAGELGASRRSRAARARREFDALVGERASTRGASGRMAGSRPPSPGAAATATTPS